MADISFPEHRKGIVFTCVHLQRLQCSLSWEEMGGVRALCIFLLSVLLYDCALGSAENAEVFFYLLYFFPIFNCFFLKHLFENLNKIHQATPVLAGTEVPQQFIVLVHDSLILLLTPIEDPRIDVSRVTDSIPQNIAPPH